MATPTRMRPARPVIERASPADRAFLAIDAAGAPEQFGVVLLFGDGGTPDVTVVRRLLAERVPAVPRLRQRLTPVPFGCGGPIWVDSPDFDVRRHVRALRCPAPGDDRALLDIALSLVTTPLPRDVPLWSAVLVTGLADGASALVLVVHHALADGIGGLAVLTRLVDVPAGVPADVPAAGLPKPAPGRADLVREAFTARREAVRHVARSWRLLRASMGAGGGLRPPRAARCSLNRRTGPDRRLVVVRADLAALRTVSHRCGATANDAVLVALAGALRHLLLKRGESVDAIAVAVPVSGRSAGDGPALGNMVSPMLVSVPATGSVPYRLRQVAAQVRAQKASATGPPPIALLGWLFRLFAALGVYRWYLGHQHRFHTLASHVRGPAEQVLFGGSPVTSAIPIATGPGGNLPVHFDALSYAGTLILTAAVDPGCFPDADEVADALRAEFDLVAEAGTASDRTAEGE